MGDPDEPIDPADLVYGYGYKHEAMGERAPWWWWLWEEVFLNPIHEKLRKQELKEAKVSKVGGLEIDPFSGPFNLSLQVRSNLFVFATMVYLYYRSIAKPTFDLNPFCVDPSGALGLVFIACFAATRRRTYLIYAVNPFRDVVLSAMQWIDPSLALRDERAELIRDTISALLQLACGLVALLYVVPQPMGRGTRWRRLVPFLEAEGRSQKVLTRILVITAMIGPIVMFVVGHEMGYLNITDNYMALKIAMVIPLGMSEEISWREVVLQDTNNAIAALVWGTDHLVGGEGMSNPYLYGLVAVIYGFLLGILSPYRFPRYFSHASVEFVMMNSLI